MAPAATLSKKEARARLLEWCQKDERRGDEAVECGEIVLKSNPGMFGDKVWEIYEYVALAALDCYRQDMVQFCVEKLLARFPKSIRANRMKGLILEAEGRLEDAVSVYEVLLEQDPNNQAVKKRLIALHKATENWDAAIKQLVMYLETFMTDYEAWAELAMLYLHVGKLNMAAFCVEELILSHPTTDAYFVLHAEICYANKKYGLARNYYAKAVDLNRKNLKALYGLFMACICYNGPNQGDNDDLGEWARERVLEHYQGSNMLSVVEDTLQTLWPTAK